MLQRVTWLSEFYFIFCFYFPLLFIFCACALQRTQAAESGATTGSRRDLLRVGLLNVCVVYTVTANIQCVQGRTGTEFRRVLCRSFGVSFEDVTSRPPAEQIGTVLS
jgi:hypothetical protein